MRPELSLDVATEHTLRFVERHLAGPVERILEVGCGDGRLAARLRNPARALIAIDLDPENAAAARRRGVNARAANWIGFEAGSFDAILFTRSLHHIGPLQQAVQRAASHLAPGGRLIVDDFSYTDASSSDLAWLVETLRSLAGRGMVDLTHSKFLSSLLDSHDPLETWLGHLGPKGHNIHSADAMSAAIRGEFRLVEGECVPYLYRYVCGVLTGPQAGEIASELLQREADEIQRGNSAGIGRRWVAENPAGRAICAT